MRMAGAVLLRRQEGVQFSKHVLKSIKRLGHRSGFAPEFFRVLDQPSGRTVMIEFGCAGWQRLERRVDLPDESRRFRC